MIDQEFELKLQIPASQREAVRQRVATASAQRTRLQARYLDTADGHLAAAGIVLRLRREGVRWVQTLKISQSGDTLDRLEHNVPRRGVAEPEVDLSLHDETPAGALLRAALAASAPGEPGAVLQELFRTDIQRVHRLQRVKGGTVELAFDEGVIQSGGHHWPVCEVEIERISGSPAVVLDTADQWIERHGLWIDTRSKAERGHRLCKARWGRSPRPDAPMAGVAVSASAALSSPHPLPPGGGFESGPVCLNLLQSLVKPLLPALLSNASELADGLGSDEHVHQLRVSIRRLRSVMRLGDRWGPMVAEPVVPTLLEVFRLLGQQRDREVVEAEFSQALRRAGCPLEHLPHGDTVVPIESQMQALLGSRAVNRAWIALLRLAYEPQPDVHEDAVVALLNDRLERWAIEVDQLGRQFARLEEPAQHELRKRIKRLRYALDSCGVLALVRLRQPRREFTEALAQAQGLLGRHCDRLTARDLWRQACELDGRAWFAVGWLSAEISRGTPDVAKALKRLAKVDRRWRTESSAG